MPARVVRAFTFEGGGARGAASSAEALRVLEYQGEEPPIWSGESIGAVDALCGAVLGLESMRRIWRDELEQGWIFKGWKPMRAVGVVTGLCRGLWDMSPSLETLHRLLKGLRIPKNRIVIVTTTDLYTGVRQDHLLTSDTPMSACIEKTYQSCLVPLAHGARDGRWADGGISASAPVEIPVMYGATSVQVFLTERLGTSKWEGGKPLDEGMRAVEILRENLLLREMELVERVNVAPLAGERRVIVTVREPTKIVGTWMDFRRETLRAWTDVPFEKWTLRNAILESHRRRGSLPPNWLVNAS